MSFHFSSFIVELKNVFRPLLFQCLSSRLIKGSFSFRFGTFDEIQFHYLMTLNKTFKSDFPIAKLVRESLNSIFSNTESKHFEIVQKLRDDFEELSFYSSLLRT